MSSIGNALVHLAMLAAPYAGCFPCCPLLTFFPLSKLCTSRTSCFLSFIWLIPNLQKSLFLEDFIVLPTSCLLGRGRSTVARREGWERVGLKGNVVVLGVSSGQLLFENLPASLGTPDTVDYYSCSMILQEEQEEESILEENSTMTSHPSPPPTPLSFSSPTFSTYPICTSLPINSITLKPSPHGRSLLYSNSINIHLYIFKSILVSSLPQSISYIPIYKYKIYSNDEIMVR